MQNTQCPSCEKKAGFFMHSKPVCLQCDELLFDLEIELEEVAEPKGPASEKTKRRPTKESR